MYRYFDQTSSVAHSCHDQQFHGLPVSSREGHIVWDRHTVYKASVLAAAAGELERALGNECDRDNNGEYKSPAHQALVSKWLGLSVPTPVVSTGATADTTAG